jgi:hypothetical protein
MHYESAVAGSAATIVLCDISFHLVAVSELLRRPPMFSPAHEGWNEGNVAECKHRARGLPIRSWRRGHHAAGHMHRAILSQAGCMQTEQSRMRNPSLQSASRIRRSRQPERKMRCCEQSLPYRGSGVVGPPEDIFSSVQDRVRASRCQSYDAHSAKPSQNLHCSQIRQRLHHRHLRTPPQPRQIYTCGYVPG